MALFQWVVGSVAFAAGEAGELRSVLAVAGVVGVASVVVLLVVVRRCLVICPPNRLAVLSGRGHVRPDGVRVGYRLCSGGRVVRIPILEQLEFLDLTELPVSGTLTRVRMRDEAGPLEVEFAARVRLSARPPKVYAAVERFLGRNREQIAGVARETLEACLRTVLAALPRKAVLEDRAHVLQVLRDEAELNLDPLGMELERITIRRLGDDWIGDEAPVPTAVPAGL